MLLRTHSSIFIYKIKSSFPTTSILSRSPMAHNITVSLDKLTYTDYEDFGKRQFFGHFLVQGWFQILGCKIQKISRNMTLKSSDW